MGMDISHREVLALDVGVGLSSVEETLTPFEGAQCSVCVRDVVVVEFWRLRRGALFHCS